MQHIKFNSIKPMSDIPNQVGFSLTAIKKTGERIAAYVTRNDSGCHTLNITLNGSVKYSDLAGWSSYE